MVGAAPCNTQLVSILETPRRQLCRAPTVGAAVIAAVRFVRGHRLRGRRNAAAVDGFPGGSPPRLKSTAHSWSISSIMLSTAPTGLCRC